MSESIECHITETNPGEWLLRMEDPESTERDPSFTTHGPFNSFHRAHRTMKHYANPFGFSVEEHSQTDGTYQDWMADNQTPSSDSPSP